MRVAPLLITLAAIGALFLLSTSFGVRSEVPVGLGTDPQHLHPESLCAANGERRRAKQLTRLAALEQAASEQLESAVARRLTSASMTFHGRPWLFTAGPGFAWHLPWRRAVAK